MQQHNKAWILAAALMATTAAGCGGSSAPGGPAVSMVEDEPSRGRVLYLAHCRTCHGKDGRLAAGGAKILPQTELSHAAIVTQITNGAGLMPPFKSTLSAAEIDSVAAYVLTMKEAGGAAQ